MADGSNSQRECNVIRYKRVGAGELGGEGEGDGAVVGVGLREADGFEAVGAPRFKTEIAPDAGGDKARAPVPAKLALLLAEHGAATDGIVELLRLMRGAGQGQGAADAGKDDAQVVAAGAQA